jgi:5-(carboxyamino)imidazole ribonucleotide synthase
MLSVAAARLGFKTCIFEPGGDCPASHVANYHFKAAYEDESALRQFADAVDVITYEFENIPTERSTFWKVSNPSVRAAMRCGSARTGWWKRRFLSDTGLTTAPFAAVR